MRMNNDKIQMIGNIGMSLIPKEGEIISLNDVRGNKTLKQKKMENGKYYIRDNENCEWIENPDLPWQTYERMVNVLNT